MFCLGRHPLQNRQYLNPDKLPKYVVDRIPLVIYIPTPPDEPAKPFAIPETAHMYPPKPAAPPSPPKRRFRFLRLKKKPKDSKEAAMAAGAKDNEEPLTWEDHWEKSEYPFVRLEENRAACAICLLDFGEPKRLFPIKTEKTDSKSKQDEEDYQDQAAEVGGMAEASPPAQGRVPTEGAPLKLEDAGEETQPLRLLECGHVFHVSCSSEILNRKWVDVQLCSPAEIMLRPMAARCVGAVSGVSESCGVANRRGKER